MIWSPQVQHSGSTVFQHLYRPPHLKHGLVREEVPWWVSYGHQKMTFRVIVPYFWRLSFISSHFAKKQVLMPNCVSHFVYNGAFPLHGTAQYGLVWFAFFFFSLGAVPGTFFSFTTVEVPSELYHYQNVTCKFCWSPIGWRKSSLPALLNLWYETQQTR